MVQPYFSATYTTHDLNQLHRSACLYLGHCPPANLLQSHSSLDLSPLQVILPMVLVIWLLITMAMPKLLLALWSGIAKGLFGRQQDTDQDVYHDAISDAGDEDDALTAGAGSESSSWADYGQNLFAGLTPSWTALDIAAVAAEELLQFERHLQDPRNGALDLSSADFHHALGIGQNGAIVISSRDYQNEFSSQRFNRTDTIYAATRVHMPARRRNASSGGCSPGKFFASFTDTASGRELLGITNHRFVGFTSSHMSALVVHEGSLTGQLRLLVLRCNLAPFKASWHKSSCLYLGHCPPATLLQSHSSLDLSPLQVMLPMVLATWLLITMALPKLFLAFWTGTASGLCGAQQDTDHDMYDDALSEAGDEADALHAGASSERSSRADYGQDLFAELIPGFALWGEQDFAAVAAEEVLQFERHLQDSGNGDLQLGSADFHHALGRPLQVCRPHCNHVQLHAGTSRWAQASRS
ncbi:hypothetical protein WJX73_005222 [Symbiochloris irregularis]|uniref:Uncharacterized protein n=1 Tax=Symbiochloris irregularis TaxID=706552 RepID=A0AAW1NRJ4_9CHLO